MTGLQSALNAKITAGALTAGKWCTSDGTGVSCTSEAPAGGGGGGGSGTGTDCGPSTVGYLWYDVTVPALKVCNGAFYLPVTAAAHPPGAPAGFVLGGGNTVLLMTWTAVSGASSYEIGYQEGTSLGAGAMIVTVAGTSTQISGVTNGQVYTAAVRTVAGAWRSGWSVTGQVTPAPTWNCTSDPAHAGCVSGSQYQSCKALKADASFTGGSAFYWIDPDGPGALAPVRAYCDLANQGGGWTLCAVTNGTNNIHTEDAQVGVPFNATSTGGNIGQANCNALIYPGAVARILTRGIARYFNAVSGSGWGTWAGRHNSFSTSAANNWLRVCYESYNETTHAAYGTTHTMGTSGWNSMPGNFDATNGPADGDWGYSIRHDYPGGGWYGGHRVIGPLNWSAPAELWVK